MDIGYSTPLIMVVALGFLFTPKVKCVLSLSSIDPLITILRVKLYKSANSSDENE